jgi:protein tyrosine phosphatase (PTP) superfamily phosphohydrolase (DUF442 family)
MRKPTLFLTIVAPVALLALEGCCCCHHHRPACAPACAPACMPGSPCPPGPALPPAGAIPAPPPAALTFPPSNAPVPGAGVPAPPPPPAVSGYSSATTPNSVYSWQPGDNNVRLSPPIAAAPGAGDNAAAPPNTASVPSKLPSGPPVTDSNAPVLPVGIPQFAMVNDKVANGLRPMLDDGLDWLKSNDYRTVLHIRKPGHDDSADRKQVEKRGIRYLTLEVSPETLSRKTVDDFNRLVSDTARYPLFVYDRDGALAGGLWYLYFRLMEHDTDETARVRAARVGLREDREGAHRAMWLAVQKLLSEQAD